MNENIKIIIFDVDDTLIYTIDTAYKKTSLAGKKVYNMSLKKTDFINLYGKHKFEECIRYWYNAKDISEFINEYNNIKLEYEYIGDIKQIIEDIKKFNIIIGIVTNSTKEKTERKLNKYIDLFDFIYVDAEKPNEKAILNIIKKYNVKTIMLTGDNKQTAEKIGKELEITEVISNVLPSQKSDTIKSLKENGNKVMMCGDGINDSPAITNADIGVSVKSGTDIAMDSSDVILTKNDLYSILKLIKISEKTVKNIKQNLFWAFFYNCLMIPVAIGFFKPLGISINPMIASLAMVFSSLTVILNALRLKKLKI